MPDVFINKYKDIPIWSDTNAVSAAVVPVEARGLHAVWCHPPIVTVTHIGADANATILTVANVNARELVTFGACPAGLTFTRVGADTRAVSCAVGHFVTRHRVLREERFIQHAS